MSQWVLSGLKAKIKTGIKTTRYPARPDRAPGVTPGLPVPRPVRSAHSGEGDAERIANRCPTGALDAREGRVDVDLRRCIHCFRCAREGSESMPWEGSYEWAAAVSPTAKLGHAFASSVHIRVVDAGDCGACLHEVKQLANPYYNLHRLGFFFTPTPRQADILLVVGPGTDQMREALTKTLTAMPTPRRVIAVGACALSGGVFGPSFACSEGIRSIVPVDIEVPGNPPPPLAILHALLVATGRAQSADSASRTRQLDAVERET